jgi:hypothetical protein
MQAPRVVATEKRGTQLIEFSKTGFLMPRRLLGLIMTTPLKSESQQARTTPTASTTQQLEVSRDQRDLSFTLVS